MDIDRGQSLKNTKESRKEHQYIIKQRLCMGSSMECKERHYIPKLSKIHQKKQKQKKDDLSKVVIILTWSKHYTEDVTYTASQNRQTQNKLQLPNYQK